MDNNFILIARSVSKTFVNAHGEKLTVVKNASLILEGGLITAIYGPSGAGKSTLLHILAGIEKPDDGAEILIEGENIANMSEKKLSDFRNKKIGLVFQFHYLLPEFTALENVMMPMLIAGDSFNKAEQKARVLLDLVGMNYRANHKPAELSGGEQQRLSIARALANDPKIIFADEPTGNLDSANSEAISKLFIDLKISLKKTFLIVTHNKDLISLADRSFEMRDGVLNCKF